MANFKTFGDLSTTAASNTVIDNNNVDENCAMSGINNAIRALGAAGKGALTFVSTSGTDTYTATLAPVPDAYATGFIYLVNFASVNTSTTPTLNLNTMGAKTIVQKDGSTALLAGDLNGAHWLEYDGTNMRLLNPVKYIGTAALPAVVGPSSSTDGDIALFSGTTGAILKDSGITLGNLLRSYLAGCALSNDGGTPNTIIDIAAGSAMSSDNTTMMITPAITKTTGSWAVGTGNGGLDTGSVAINTWYHVHIIERTDTGVVDALISTSATSPTMPANYTKKRRIGSFKTDSSAHIIPFTQIGRTFYWGNSITGAKFTTDINGQALTQNTAFQGTLNVPPGVQVRPLLSVEGVASGGISIVAIQVYSPSLNSPGSSTISQIIVNGIANGAISTPVNDQYTDTSQHMNFITGQTNQTITVVTYGWVDDLGIYS